MNEIAPRYIDTPGNYTNIRSLSHRRGDGSLLGYIEYKGNEIDKYE